MSQGPRSSSKHQQANQIEVKQVELLPQKHAGDFLRVTSGKTDCRIWTLNWGRQPRTQLDHDPISRKDSHIGVPQGFHLHSSIPFSDSKNKDTSSDQETWKHWVEVRNKLFKEYVDSPLDKKQLSEFEGLPYFDYDPSWRIVGKVSMISEDSQSNNPLMKKQIFHVNLPSDGQFSYERIGLVHFTTPKGEEACLSLFWIKGYGGGVFIPFRDANDEVYGGGRYLYDTIKGSDLGVSGDFKEIVLDFNYSYHPSCFYNDRWTCPLAPNEKQIAICN